jgi:hypothetical protein
MKFKHAYLDAFKGPNILGFDVEAVNTTTFKVVGAVVQLVETCIYQLQARCKHTSIPSCKVIHAGCYHIQIVVLSLPDLTRVFA